MPRGDETGPREQGFDGFDTQATQPKPQAEVARHEAISQPDSTQPFGRLRASSKGQSTGRGIIGKGMGRMGGTRPGAGLGGQCICPACGAKVEHQGRISCYNVSCPKCGAQMTRQESPRIYSWSGTRPDADIGGQCICPVCGAKVEHQVKPLRIPCYEVSCPKCGAQMTRQESPRIHSWG
jgi:predicted RNA-binding Zn-ribbon protein involved in translation (DUF1610 family)